MLAAVGYAVADVMPWSMLGEVIDEDELATGERREGVYVGFFLFLRKLGGGIAVAGIGLALDWCGFDGSLAREQQAPLALEAIRVSTSLVPAGFLLLAIWVARGYPLDRAAHARILAGDLASLCRGLGLSWIGRTRPAPSAPASARSGAGGR